MDSIEIKPLTKVIGAEVSGIADRWRAARASVGGIRGRYLG